MRLDDVRDDLPRKIAEAGEMLRAAVEEHQPREIHVMFSGGHDSLAAGAVAAEFLDVDGAFHANTGIGIEETREYVRRTCREFGWPLHEYHATDPSYDDLVMDKGFPHGPHAHGSMYFYLKKKQLRKFVQDRKREYRDRILLVTGVRTSESDRRRRSPVSVPVRRDGAKVFVNPILAWTGLDVSRYIDLRGLRRNEVADTIHRSGECLCGAFADPEEIHEIEAWYPEAAARIRALEERAREAGLVDSVWAVSTAPGKKWEDLDDGETVMCQGCIHRHRPDADLPEGATNRTVLSRIVVRDPSPPEDDT